MRPAVALCLALASLGTRADAPEPSAQRQRELVRMVRQDCGSCHGLHLTGGLGPALTREALAGKPLESMASTIYGGRPGTPMAPWKAMLTEDEAHWIARQLLAGFPDPALFPRRQDLRDHRRQLADAADDDRIGSFETGPRRAEETP